MPSERPEEQHDVSDLPLSCERKVMIVFGQQIFRCQKHLLGISVWSHGSDVNLKDFSSYLLLIGAVKKL